MNAVHTLTADDFALREFFAVCAQIERRLRTPVSMQAAPVERTIGKQRQRKPAATKTKKAPSKTRRKAGRG